MNIKDTKIVITHLSTSFGDVYYINLYINRDFRIYYRSYKENLSPNDELIRITSINDSLTQTVIYEKEKRKIINFFKDKIDNDEFSSNITRSEKEKIRKFVNNIKLYNKRSQIIKLI